MCSVSFQMPKILGTTYFINNYNLELEFGAKKCIVMVLTPAEQYMALKGIK